jgi:two-component system sensor histidine kinase BaeS
MPDRHSHRSKAHDWRIYAGHDREDWKQWQEAQAWWTGQSSGWAWRGVARRMFIGLVGFLALWMLVLVLIGVVLGSVFESGWIAAIAAPLLVLALAIVVIRWTMATWRPVSSLMAATGKLADGDYGVRMDSAGSASMKPIAASFNDMARRLETADEQRRRLLADLGHELRTPLTVVRGEIEAMIDGVHQPDGEQLGLLLDEVRVMERLLDDLKTLSLAEAGALALHPEPTDLVDLVSDVADTYRRSAAEAGIAVTFESDPELPEVVIDPVRIREVITNLVVNAIRAMPDGGDLGLTVSRADSGWSITVADTGAGMTPEEVARVFDRFIKGRNSNGTGLGLTISRDLVQAHGGTISLESVPGDGTVATVRLPARSDHARVE